MENFTKNHTAADIPSFALKRQHTHCDIFTSPPLFYQRATAWGIPLFSWKLLYGMKKMP